MKTFDLVINGQIKRVYAEKVRNVLWFHYDGRTRSIDMGPAAMSRSSKKAKSAQDQILAPMPGKILKVLAAENNTVAAGEALVVMEAMKMEYTLTADASAQVIQIKCKEGDQVELGQILVQLKLERGGAE